MKITISGFPGSGKTTISKVLAKELGLKLLNIGNLRRKAAEQKEMTLKEFNKWSEKNLEKGDKYFDDYQKEFGKENDNFIIEGRMGAHCVQDSIKIYLDVDLKEGAKRILRQKLNKEGKRKKEDINFNDLKEIEISIKKRVKSDKKRYKELYNFDPNNKKHYDLIINTTNLSVKEIIKKIKDKLK